MVVVQINAAYEYGSTGRTVKEMHEHLIEKGVKSYVYYPDNFPGRRSDEVIGTTLDYKVHAFLSRLTGLQAYFSFFSTKRLIKKLEKIKPNIVVIRNIHSNYINLPLLTKYLAAHDIATVIVLHDCWFYTGHCFHYTEVGCDKWQNECNNCPLIHKNNTSWFFDTSKWVFRHRKEMMDAIPHLAVVGVSEWITGEARKSPIFENAKVITRIYNWIDLNRFYPRDTARITEKYKTEGAFVVLGVAMSWDYHKGMEVFIELAKALPDIKIVMIGQMPEIALPSNIIKVERTSSVEELAEHYSMADVLLNLSLQESFGKVAAEALACGTPLIVNNATANTELPGDCGYVIESNELSQITDAIKRIEKVGKLSYSKRCVERAKSLFEKDKNLKAYDILFNDLLRNK